MSSPDYEAALRELDQWRETARNEMAGRRLAEERAEKAEASLLNVVGTVQRFQPGGSPPPGDAKMLVMWICGTLADRARKAEHDRDELKAEAEGLARDNAAMSLEWEDTKAERDELRTRLCHHGWGGAAPKDGARIVTPCPSCGERTLFVGDGGHLTCGNLGAGGNRGEPYSGCTSPGVEDSVAALKARLARVVEAGDEVASLANHLSDCRTGWCDCGLDKAKENWRAAKP